MERLAYLEILDRRGQVSRRVSLRDLPFHLGRAYANDLILEDPYISPNHAVIETVPGGTLRVRDTASKNGLFSGDGKTSRDALELRDDSEFCIGRTRIRLRDVSHDVAPALPARRRSGFRYWLGHHWSAALVMLVLVALVTFASQMRDTYTATNWTAVAGTFLRSALALGLLAGAWAMITRVLTPRTRLVGHFVYAACFTLGEELIAWIGSYSRFVFASIAPIQLFEFASALLLAALLFLGHLRLTRALGPLRRVGLASVLALLFVAGDHLNTLQTRPDWVQTLPYWSRLQPLPAALINTQSEERFFEAASSLRQANPKVPEFQSQ